MAVAVNELEHEHELKVIAMHTLRNKWFALIRRDDTDTDTIDNDNDID